MADYVIKGETLTEIADAIREKKDDATGGSIPVTSMAGEILAIESKADPLLQSKEVSSDIVEQVVRPDPGYDGLSDVTVHPMPNQGAVQATINGLTTNSYTIRAGYHNGSGKVSLTNDIENALAAI